MDRRRDSGAGGFWGFLAASLLLVLAGPVLLGGAGAWLGARFADLVLGRTSDGESDELREQLVELMIENAALREEIMKTERYRLLLGLTRVSEREAVAGRVLYRTEGLVGGTLVVDRGGDDGVSVNSVCLAPSGLVGVVTSAGPGTCEVLPLTSPQVRVSCVTRPSGAMGILQCVDGDLVMQHVDPAREVAPGEEVVTSRFGGVYPDGLLIGTVTGSELSPSSLAREVRVDPAVEFDGISEVLILVGGESEGEEGP